MRSEDLPLHSQQPVAPPLSARYRLLNLPVPPLASAVVPVRGPAIDRLMARVDKKAVPGCWTWTGAMSKKGYGGMRLEGGRHQSVHRFSYEYHKGPIPDGLQIDHLCRNRACVNPSHLEAVTSQVNSLRGLSVAAQNAAKTHCIHGHPLDGDNLDITKGGGRRCRTCRRARRMRYYYAKRSAA